jgi:tetratricopeptide (TPR) repeat protein
MALGLPALLAASPQAGQNQDPQFQIQIDVTGKTGKVKSKDQWGELRSKNFVVVGDADEQDLKTSASELELFRLNFAELFPRAAQTSSVPTRVVVFRDRRSLRTYRPPGDEPSEESYFSEGVALNHIVMPAGEKPSRAIMRAYSRVLLRDSISPVPLWLETGILEYFSAYKLTRLGEDRMVKLGIDEYKGISEKNLLPLSILMAVDRESFQQMDPQIQKTFTAESCLLFQYLLQTRRLTAAVRMTNVMAEGRPIEQAFRDAFKLPMASVQENLKNHIKMSKYGGWAILMEGLTLDPNKHYIRVTWSRSFKTLPVTFDHVRAAAEALPMKILSNAEADVYRGDLQLHNGRPIEAEDFLRRALREEPTSAAAYASLGFSQAQQKNFVEAYRSLDRARVLDPSGNGLGYFYTALAIRDEATDSGQPLTSAQLDEMEAALRDAVDVMPDLVPAVEMLAETSAINRRNPAVSMRLLVDALRRSPGKESLLFTLARVSAAGGDKTSAGWMLQRLISSGGTSSQQKEDARSLLVQLNLTPEQKTAFGDFKIDESYPARHQTVPTKADIKAASASSKETRVVRGYLSEVKCSKGLTLYIRLGTAGIDERTENLHSDSGSVEWVSDTGENLEAVKCDKMWVRTAITYRPKRKGLMMGEPLIVEFCRGDSFDCDVRQPPQTED